MRIQIVIEVREGERAEFEREVDDIVAGHGSHINAGQLRSMWQSLSGEVSHWLRYREPAETGMEKQSPKTQER